MAWEGRRKRELAAFRAVVGSPTLGALLIFKGCYTVHSRVRILVLHCIKSHPTNSALPRSYDPSLLTALSHPLTLLNTLSKFPSSNTSSSLLSPLPPPPGARCTNASTDRVNWSARVRECIVGGGEVGKVGRRLRMC